MVTSYDRHDLTKVHVRECMNSLTLPDEIIVVNDGGTPDLKEKLQQLDKKTKIIYAEILPPKIIWNYHGAYNLGFWLSRGDFISFEDNDNIPTKEWYGQALQMLEEHPEMGRIIGKKRLHISSQDLEKPVEEWQITGSRGPNQGTSMIRRELILKVKGQDERFCGQYGWMYYDWRRRLLTQTKFGGVGQFYFVVDGQCSLSRNPSAQNYRLYRRGCNEKTIQFPTGILNFQYTFEIL